MLVLALSYSLLCFVVVLILDKSSQFLKLNEFEVTKASVGKKKTFARSLSK